MDIAVYSGSFNPLHIGHLAIIRHLINEAGFDKVYLIVSPKNPLKTSVSSATGKVRYESAVQAISRHFPADSADGRKVIVDDIELTMPEPHYTIKTLDALKEREPGNTFTLTIGADNLADIRRWRDYRRILTEYGIAVFPRRGHDLKSLQKDLADEIPGCRIQLLDAEMVDISSTEIRNAIAEGKDISDYII